MEFGGLKQSVEKIEMPEEMKQRIIRNCRLSAAHKTEEITMKKKLNFSVQKALSIAAVIALCLCASAAAANHAGVFRDIMDWKGAVVGTEYVQASDEIGVSAAAEQGVLAITATFLDPDAFPYRAQETFGVGHYEIVDASGNVIAEGEGDSFAEVLDGQAVMAVSLDDLENGAYKLLISSFVGCKKADQPLRIGGSWECDFTI